MARPKKGEEKQWIPKFLSSLCDRPYVARACSEAGISRSRVYKLKKEDEAFSAAWDEAMENGLDWVENDLHRIGIGEIRGQYGALIYLLKCRRYEIQQGQNMPSKLILQWGSEENE